MKIVLIMILVFMVPAIAVGLLVICSGILAREKGSIQFKNINLSGVSFERQMAKYSEEVMEFREAVFSRNPDHAIEEYYDMMQAGLGCLQKIGVNADEVTAGYADHLEKIKNRPRD